MTQMTQIGKPRTEAAEVSSHLRNLCNLRITPSPAMKLLTTTAAALFAFTAARAALVTETYGPNVVNTAIPDNDPVLTSFLHSITTSTILQLTEVAITFELRGTTEDAGWASDMFASLIRSPVGVAPSVSDPSAVLLNQVGISSGELSGFGFDGWNITLRDQAPVGDPSLTDIHNESLISGVLTGTFQPDGRVGNAALDPGRTALLGAFNGGTGNGDWRLNVGDLAEIGTMRLVSWSLTLTGEDTVSAVPETSTWAAGAGLAGLLAARWLRRSVR
jgi:hypothetical protein